MVATNILSLYHLSSTRSNSPPRPQMLDLAAADNVPDHLLQQLHTIRATITHLTRLRSSPSSNSASFSPVGALSELLLYSHIGPIASACSDHPDLLYRYMNYTPFTPCPHDLHSVAEPLLLCGCHPLPRRRCFSPTSPKPLNPSSLPSDPFPTSLPDAAVLWPPTVPCRSFSCLPTSLGFDPKTEASRFLSVKSALDLPLPQLVSLARSTGAAPIHLALDVGGGTGTLATHLRLLANATVLTTTMNLGAPYSKAAVLRRVAPAAVPGPGRGARPGPDRARRQPLDPGAGVGIPTVRCGPGAACWGILVDGSLLLQGDRSGRSIRADN